MKEWRLGNIMMGNVGRGGRLTIGWQIKKKWEGLVGKTDRQK
jgi:hypothetical protein